MTSPTAAPAYAPGAMGAPGRVLGFLAFVFAFCIPPAGFVMGVVARVQSRRAGVTNSWAVASIVIGIVFTLLWVAFWLLMLFLVFLPVIGICQELGPGFHTEGNSTYTCSGT